MKEIKLPFVLRTALVLISILILGFIIKVGQPILAPLFFAFLFALLFTPFASFFERRLKFNRALSTGISVIVLSSILLGIIWFFTTQLSHFVNDFPQLQKQVTESSYQFQLWVSKTFNVDFKMQMEYLNQGLEKLLNSSGIILGVTFGMLSSIGAFFTFSVLFFIFILQYRRILYQFALQSFAEEHRTKVEEITLEVQKVIKQYMVGVILQIIIVTIFTTILLKYLDVKYAFLLGVLAGILNVIPYIGIITAWAFAAIISFATSGGDTIPFLMIGYTVIHIIDANIVLPLVVGSKVKINALVTFLGLLLGEMIWGITGMFLSIPFLAILKIIFERTNGLESWAILLGENKDKKKPRKKYRITKNIVLEEKE